MSDCKSQRSIDERSELPRRDAPVAPWRSPTRRAFVAMLGAAAAALAVRGQGLVDGSDPDRRSRVSKTIWIGHC